MEKLKYNGVIWDFDGTLFDTYPQMAHTLTQSMEQLGVKVCRDEAYRLMKISLDYAVEFYADAYKLLPEAIHNNFMNIKVDVSKAKPFPHIKAVLADFKNAGGKSFIFTHRGSSVFAYLEHWNMTESFADIIPFSESFERKPNPSGNLHIIEKHRLNPSQVLAVGDRELDILAGKNAGIAACLFYQPGKQNAPITAADYVIDSFDEIYGVLGINL